MVKIGMYIHISEKNAHLTLPIATTFKKKKFVFFFASFLLFYFLLFHLLFGYYW